MSTDVPPPSGPRDARGPLARWLANPRTVLGLLITAAALWFVIANNTTVRIRLWVVWVSAQLWLVLLLTFIAGSLVGLLFARQRRRRRERNRA